MPKVELPGGSSAVIGLRMAEFRELWNSGAVQRMQAMGEGADLAEFYPVMARAVRRWDCTDLDGKPLDPARTESYDELEAPVFMRLLTALTGYLNAEGPKN